MPNNLSHKEKITLLMKEYRRAEEKRQHQLVGKIGYLCQKEFDKQAFEFLIKECQKNKKPLLFRATILSSLSRILLKHHTETIVSKTVTVVKRLINEEETRNSEEWEKEEYREAIVRVTTQLCAYSEPLQGQLIDMIDPDIENRTHTRTIVFNCLLAVEPFKNLPLCLLALLVEEDVSIKNNLNVRIRTFFDTGRYVWSEVKPFFSIDLIDKIVRKNPSTISAFFLETIGKNIN
ncbi:MAG: hypothetical protein ACTSO7_07905 [Candidatus Heimdallarchaeota archaeon]